MHKVNTVFVMVIIKDTGKMSQHTAHTMEQVKRRIFAGNTAHGVCGAFGKVLNFCTGSKEKGRANLCKK
jgi:hypothetical protein